MKLLILFAVFLCSLLLSAAVPAKIPVQGTLSDKNGNLINDEAAQVTFSIYDAEKEGKELWTEERTLLIEKGRIAIYLGEVTPLTYEKIGGKKGLWLSINYKGEELSRIELASVPFAMEAGVAHQAETLGKYSEKSLDEVFASACEEGSYLRGWSGKTPICQSDEKGEAATYIAGHGIKINGKEISIDQSIDFYSAADDSVVIKDGKISVNPYLYALINHQHNNDYYLKNEVYTKAEVYNKTEADSRYIYNESFAPEQFRNVIPRIYDGRAQPSAIRENDYDIQFDKNIKFRDGQSARGFKQLNNQCIAGNAVSGTTWLKYNNVQLTGSTAFCSLNSHYTWRAGNDADVLCEVNFDGSNNWFLQVSNGGGASVKCCASCVVWNW